MRLATYNIRHGRVTGGHWRGTGRLVRSCAELEADILALQELDVRSIRSGFAHQPRRIARALGAEWEFSATRHIAGAPYGIALLVRGSLTDVEVLELPGGVADEPRRAIVATVTIAGGDGGSSRGTLAVAATHLTLHRADAEVQLAHVAAALSWRGPGPRVLLGDLNLGVEAVRPIVEAAALELVATGPTFPAEAPTKCIDHIAVAGLAVVDATVLATGISDHRAVVATVR